MSWLNNSLNSLKGTITNLAQEVLAEHNQQDDDEITNSEAFNQMEILEESEKKISELTGVCENQNIEIAALRQHIAELKLQINENNRNKVMSSSRDGNFEDSWFWEPDNASSPESPSGSTNIRKLPENYHDSEAFANAMASSSGSSGAGAANYDVASGTANQQNTKFAALSYENSCLFTKVVKLEKENEALNKKLKEIDIQHNIAIENVLQVQNLIQQNFQSMSRNYEAQIQTNINQVDQYTNLKTEMDLLTEQFENLQTSNARLIQENSVLTAELANKTEELNVNSKETQNLKTELNLKNNQLIELVIKAENELTDDNNKEDENSILKKKLRELNDQLDEVENFHKKSYKTKSSDICSSTSSSGKQSDDEFIVLDNENPTTASSSSLSNWESKYNELIAETILSKKTIENLNKIIDQLKMEVESVNTENAKHLQEIETFQNAEHKSPQEYEEMSKSNQMLKEEISTANLEFVEYQNEQSALRKELEEKILNMEDKLLDLQEKYLMQGNEKLAKIAELEKLVEQKTETAGQLSADKTELQNLMFDLNLKNLDLENKLYNVEKNNSNLHQMINLQKEDQKTNNKPTTMANINRSATYDNLNRDANYNTTEDSTENLVPTNTPAPNIPTNQDHQKTVKEPVDLELPEISTEKLVKFEYLQNIFSVYFQFEMPTISDHNSLKAALKTIKSQIDELELNLEQNLDELSKLNDERAALKHNITTLKADNQNYKIECDEVTKNNGILLEELNNYSKKLQPIPEYNEETVSNLEKQIEELTKLNQTITKNSDELQAKFEASQTEIREFHKNVAILQDNIENLTTTVINLTAQNETVEAEKCNLIFEINEMKTDDKKSELVSELSALQHQIRHLQSDIVKLTQQNQSLENSLHKSQAEHSDLQNQMEQLASTARQNDQMLTEKNTKIEDLEQQVNQLSNRESDKANSQLVTDANQLLIEQVKQEHIKELTILQDKYQNLQESSKQEQEKFKIDLEQRNVLNEDLTKQLKKLSDEHTSEKDELHKNIQIKYHENLQYFNEIQRLSLLLETLEKEKSILKESLLSKSQENCQNCGQLTNLLNATSSDLEKVQKQYQMLIQKSEILQGTLITDQSQMKLLQNENVELQLQKSNLCKDLDRLREHLVNLEESHTKECIEMETVIQETKSKMISMEEAASKMNNAYTSGSIRANQHAETIQAQYSLLNQQRDDLANKLSAAEDRESKNQAALVNLQCALEQFQRGKEKDIEIAVQKIRRELNYEKDKQELLQIEIIGLKEKLSEANQGLLAASRISDQLENSKDTISFLKDEIEKLTKRSVQVENKLQATESSADNQIDKNLIKSLLINYMLSNNKTDQMHIFRVISSILEFNTEEIHRIGLKKFDSHNDWLGSFLSNNKPQGNNSLAQSFVNFLEKESEPREKLGIQPNLLKIINENVTMSDNSVTSSSTQQTNNVAGGTNIDSKTPNATWTAGSANNSTPATMVASTTSILTGAMPKNLVNSRPRVSLTNPNVFNTGDHVFDEQFQPSRNSSSILKDILSDKNQMDD